MLLPACSNDVELAENDMEMPETVEVALNMVGDAVTVSESPLTRAFNGAEELYAVQVYFQDPGEAYENLIDAKTKKPVTINLDIGVISYFKELAEETGIAYQNLMNLYLVQCAQEKKRPVFA